MPDDILKLPPAGKRNVGRPPKSGIYSGSVLAPTMLQKQEEIILALRVMHGEGYNINNSDQIAVKLLSRALTHIEAIDNYLAVHGIVSIDANGSEVPASMYKVYFTALNSAARMCDQLGLNPKSRVALGFGMLQATGLAEKMARAAEDTGDDPETAE